MRRTKVTPICLRTNSGRGGFINVRLQLGAAVTLGSLLSAKPTEYAYAT